MKRRKIVIVGAGYVGIAVSIILSDNNDIVLYDIDNSKVDLMKSGTSPINDEDMCEFFKSIKMIVATPLLAIALVFLKRLIMS